jgi:hypothetical protein
MLPQLRRPVCLTLSALNQEFSTRVETFATVYQKAADRFHLVLTEPLIWDRTTQPEASPMLGGIAIATTRLLWLEMSPQRATLTMQGNGPFSYRHCWEHHALGSSRFWLHDPSPPPASPTPPPAARREPTPYLAEGPKLAPGYRLSLRNYTHSLIGRWQAEWPLQLRVDYELYAADLAMGHYCFNLEMLGGW